VYTTPTLGIADIFFLSRDMRMLYYLGVYTTPTLGIADIFFLSSDMRMCAGKPARATDNEIVVENQGESLESEGTPWRRNKTDALVF
jgi:hypothetical protein